MPSRPVALPLLSSLLLLLPSFGSCSWCDLDPWLNDQYGTDHGYHVLCITKGSVEIFVNGLTPAAGKVFEAETNRTWHHVVHWDTRKFSDELEKLLKIKSKLVFTPQRQKDGQGVWTGDKLSWPKQSWALFKATDGERSLPEDAWHLLETYEGVALLFEGGVWRWPTVRIGYERGLLEGVSLRTVAMQPALFEFVFRDEDSSSRLGPQLLADVVAYAKPHMAPSQTEGKVSKIRTSTQAWVGYQYDPRLRLLKNLTEQAVRVPGWHFDMELQVLRYEKDQLYDAHRDYWDPREFPDPERWLHRSTKLWYMRHLTVLWFLQVPEEGGGTWFPRAHGGPTPVGEWTACDDRGVMMSGHNGTIAILFYSLYSNGEVDEFSWHCGCPVIKGTKWAANSWVWNQAQYFVADHLQAVRRKSPKKAKQETSEL